MENKVNTTEERLLRVTFETNEGDKTVVLPEGQLLRIITAPKHETIQSHLQSMIDNPGIRYFIQPDKMQDALNILRPPVTRRLPSMLSNFLGLGGAA